MTMVECVARALLQCAKDNRSTYRDGEYAWHDYRDDARKIIQAMASPTDEMNRAGSEVHGRQNYPTSELDAASVWERMIDAALKEGQ